MDRQVGEQEENAMLNDHKSHDETCGCECKCNSGQLNEDRIWTGWHTGIAQSRK